MRLLPLLCGLLGVSALRPPCQLRVETQALGTCTKTMIFTAAAEYAAGEEDLPLALAILHDEGLENAASDLRSRAGGLTQDVEMKSFSSPNRVNVTKLSNQNSTNANQEASALSQTMLESVGELVVSPSHNKAMVVMLYGSSLTVPALEAAVHARESGVTVLAVGDSASSLLQLTGHENRHTFLAQNITKPDEALLAGILVELDAIAATTCATPTVDLSITLDAAAGAPFDVEGDGVDFEDGGGDGWTLVWNLPEGKLAPGSNESMSYSIYDGCCEESPDAVVTGISPIHASIDAVSPGTSIVTNFGAAADANMTICAQPTLAPPLPVPGVGVPGPSDEPVEGEEEGPDEGEEPREGQADPGTHLPNLPPEAPVALPSIAPTPAPAVPASELSLKWVSVGDKESSPEPARVRRLRGDDGASQCGAASVVQVCSDVFGEPCTCDFALGGGCTDAKGGPGSLSEVMMTMSFAQEGDGATGAQQAAAAVDRMACWESVGAFLLDECNEAVSVSLLNFTQAPVAVRIQSHDTTELQLGTSESALAASAAAASRSRGHFKLWILLYLLSATLVVLLMWVLGAWKLESSRKGIAARAAADAADRKKRQQFEEALKAQRKKEMMERLMRPKNRRGASVSLDWSDASSGKGLIRRLFPDPTSPYLGEPGQQLKRWSVAEAPIRSAGNHHPRLSELEMSGSTSGGKLKLKESNFEEPSPLSVPLSCSSSREGFSFSTRGQPDRRLRKSLEDMVYYTSSSDDSPGGITSAGSPNSAVVVPRLMRDRGLGHSNMETMVCYPQDDNEQELDISSEMTGGSMADISLEEASFLREVSLMGMLAIAAGDDTEPTSNEEGAAGMGSGAETCDESWAGNMTLSTDSADRSGNLETQPGAAWPSPNYVSSEEGSYGDGTGSRVPSTETETSQTGSSWHSNRSEDPAMQTALEAQMDSPQYSFFSCEGDGSYSPES